MIRYFTKQVKRSLVICRSNKLQTTRLIMFLEKHNDDYIELEDEFGKCSTCAYTRKLGERMRSHMRSFRVVKLHTLCQVNPHVKLEDWVCPLCNRLVYYAGILHSIFPVQRNRAYKNELLYIWVDHVSCLGYSFRSAYESYHIMSTSTSALSRFT